jgi:hypothetical protein
MIKEALDVEKSKVVLLFGWSAIPINNKYEKLLIEFTGAIPNIVLKYIYIILRYYIMYNLYLIFLFK